MEVTTISQQQSPERHDDPEPLPEQLQRGEDAIDRSRNLRHLVAMQRVLQALRVRRWTERNKADSPPPLSH